MVLRFAHLKPALWSCDLIPAYEDFSSRSKPISVGNDLKSVISDGDDHPLKIQLIKVCSAWKVKGSGLFV